MSEGVEVNAESEGSIKVIDDAAPIATEQPPPEANDDAAVEPAAPAGDVAGLYFILRFQICFVLSYLQIFNSVNFGLKFLGPFYGAIAVPSVTRCRCRCRRGHRCAGGVRQ